MINYLSKSRQIHWSLHQDSSLAWGKQSHRFKTFQVTEETEKNCHHIILWAVSTRFPSLLILPSYSNCLSVSLLSHAIYILTPRVPSCQFSRDAVQFPSVSGPQVPWWVKYQQSSFWRRRSRNRFLVTEHTHTPSRYYPIFDGTFQILHQTGCSYIVWQRIMKYEDLYQSVYLLYLLCN